MEEINLFVDYLSRFILSQDSDHLSKYVKKHTFINVTYCSSNTHRGNNLNSTVEADVHGLLGVSANQRQGK